MSNVECVERPSQSKKPKTISLLSWVNNAMKESSEVNIDLDIAEDSMSIWNVNLTLEMFASKCTFEVLGDNGWIPLRHDLNQVFENLLSASNVLDKSDTSTCYQIGDAWYEAYVKDGSLMQKNLQTDVQREIRKSTNQLHADISKWFQKYGKGRKPGVHLQLKFPPNFPMSPPFVRIVCPRFQYQTGRVTVGGSMCSETLTMTGWNPKIPAVAFL